MKKLILATLLLPTLLSCKPKAPVVNPNGSINVSGSFQRAATVTSAVTGFSPRVYTTLRLTLKQLSPTVVEVSSPTFETFMVKGSSAVNGPSYAVGDQTGNGLAYQQATPLSKLAIDWTTVNSSAQTQVVHFAGLEVK